MACRIKAFVTVFAIDKQEPTANTTIEVRSTTLGDKCCRLAIAGHEYLVKRDDLIAAIQAVDKQGVY